MSTKNKRVPRKEEGTYTSVCPNIPIESEESDNTIDENTVEE